ncbi:LysM peptidoglycan-binding domain-containing protein [Hyalangium rubrum]|uniref:Penicillin-insensitive murein endopeptidase n=1 Tax=Hyalangium rubrum TaxID=3103134 RepID=A0ABU5H730_9BACT|nr:penicillin-insensitive murein endopeptidase [Hyalangium sp. s54d21]MDY7229283.1 penicillin-insensitive murein endopeptidase [Hyalangium sp. s54d21]
MRFSLCLIPLLCVGCAAHVGPPPSASVRPERPEAVAVAPPVAASEPAPAAPSSVTLPAEPTAPAVALVEPAAATPAESPDATEAPEGEGDEEDASPEVAGFDSADGDEAETPAEPGSEIPGMLYTADLSDEELEKRWKDDPASLGSVSVGFVHSGRLVNSVRFPQEKDWLVVSPEKAWTTQETVDYMTRVIRELRTRFPEAPLLRVNQISGKDGGHIRPHKSHQNGRDVDLGFYYPGGNPVRARARENYIDPKMNWELVRALVTLTDVQIILVDRRVQKVLYDFALKNGEDKAWLDSLFHAGENSIIKHARGHRDHFHVRFFNPRAQELGRRIAPLLALQPEHNIAMHRVRSGDTLGAIAMRFNSTVTMIRNANRIRGHMLRIGQVLSVPLRGPCNRCPVPPPVVIPPRRMPAEAKAEAETAPAEQPAEEVRTASELPGS